ncbi:hypothetical protein ACEQ8H_001885 [Pleosporales sp. CAS-2024a]
MNTPSISPEQLAILAGQDQGPKTVALVVTFTALAFVFVLLRLIVRIQFTQLIGWEDYLIAVTMLFSIATGVCQVRQVHFGNGKHQIFVDLPSTIESLKYLYCSILTYCFGFTFIKISILTQYRRIFSVTETRIPIYVLMVISVASGTAALFTFMFACIPVDAFWNVLKRPTARCLSEQPTRYAHGIINTVTDLLIAALPVRGIWRLQIERGHKIALVVVLTLGWVVCIVSILRLDSLFVLSRHSDDRMFYGAPPAYWAAIEMNLSIVCASVPALKPLLVKVIPAFASRITGHKSSQRSETTKNSALTGSFQRLKGGDASRDRSVDYEQGYMGSELTAFGALPSVHEVSSGHEVPSVDEDAVEKGQVRVTHDVRLPSS